jgi:hypothetical protein
MAHRRTSRIGDIDYSALLWRIIEVRKGYPANHPQIAAIDAQIKDIEERLLATK